MIGNPGLGLHLHESEVVLDYTSVEITKPLFKIFAAKRCIVLTPKRLLYYKSIQGFKENRQILVFIYL